MVDLARTPSAQHAVAMIADTVEGTVRNFEKLEAARISISLEPGRRLFKPMMEGFGVDWAVRQCEAEREKNIKPNIGLVEAFGPYAAEKAVDWFRAYEPQYYPIGSGVLMPVKPSGFWFEGGRPRILWVQCWKARTLDPLQKRIFHTILQRSVVVGDFKDAEIEWVDLRETRPGKGRDVEVLHGSALGTVSDDELQAYLQILLSAFQQYKSDRDRRRAEGRASERSRPQGPMPLFPDDPDGP